MSLTVSIAVFNPDLKIFEKMLRSLKKFTPELTQLIIIDNASDNKEFATLLEDIFDDAEKGLSRIIIIEGINLGFGRAHNKALERATGEYFAVLNDDIEFFSPWADKMIDILQFDEQVGQVGIRKGQFNVLDRKLNAHMVDTDSPEYVEGSCFMMRTEIAKTFDLFDDAYEFAYFEDTDLSLRLRKSGFTLKSVEVDWIHHRATTSSKNPVDVDGFHVKNENFFRERWGGYIVTKNFADLLVVKRGGAYGDVFLLGPILDALKKKFGCTISLMTQAPEAMLYHPAVSGFSAYTYPVKCNHFLDLDFSYERDFRHHIIDVYKKVSGVFDGIDIKKHGTLYTNDEINAKIDMVTKDEEYVTLDLSSTWGAKQWPLEKYIAMIDYFHDNNKKVYGVGASDTIHFNLKLDKNFINQLSILETGELIRRASLHLGHEGLLAHFAQAVRVPHVIVYGCTSPEYVSDISLPEYRGVISPVACQGCRHHFAAGCGITCRRTNHFYCMQAITVESVISAVESLKASELLEVICA